MGLQTFLPIEILDYVETHEPSADTVYGISQRELAKALGYHPCSMSRPLNQLVRDGLLAAGLPNVFTTGAGSIFSQTYWGAQVTREAIGSYSLMTATIAEAFGTAVLLWGILGAFDNKNLGVGANLGPLFVGFAVLAVGASLGGASGYAINPARDLAPRIFAALIGCKGAFDGIYWCVAPIVGPFLGGIFGVLSYDLLVSPHLSGQEQTSAQELEAVVETA